MYKIKRKLAVSAWIIVVTFVALSVATYAWMSIATSFKLSDLEINVITDNAVEIAIDVDGLPAEWVQSLSAAELMSTDATVRPVTWSARDKAFYAPKYGLDGRISSLEPKLVTSLADIPTSSAEAEGEGAGYLLKIDFWLRTSSSKITTYLSDPEVNPDGLMVANGSFLVGEPEWNTSKKLHDDGGKGAQNAMRIAFLTEDYYIYNEAGEPISKVEDGAFYIYEPNADPDSTTPSMDGKELAYQGDSKLIRQTSSGWADKEIPVHGEVDYFYGEFIDEDTELFTLTANNPRKITMYVWLEGQDSDCSNSISAGKILANVHFGATSVIQEDEVIRP